MAAVDSLFAPVYQKPTKNIDNCITYILNQVKKSGCCGFSDDEIFGMALHYYQEDNIEVGSPLKCNVVINHHVELSEEEKKRITEELLEDSINPYSLERTNDFFRMMFKENELPFIKSKYIKNKEEALMFVSAFIYSGEEEFGYTVELDDGYEETVIASITNMVVRRKK